MLWYYGCYVRRWIIYRWDLDSMIRYYGRAAMCEGDGFYEGGSSIGGSLVQDSIITVHDSITAVRYGTYQSTLCRALSLHFYHVLGLFSTHLITPYFAMRGLNINIPRN